jgi:hypothetical protein
MNRLLIGILDIINKLLAIFLIISSTASGYFGRFGPYLGADDAVDGNGAYRVLGAVIGFLAGLVVAALVSGFLATIINISREATAIRELMTARLAAERPPL